MLTVSEKKALTSSFQMLRKKTKNWKRSFKLIWSSSPFYTISWASLLLIQGILPGLLVYLTKLVVDSLVIALDSGGDWEKVRPAVIYIVAIASVMLLIDITKSLLEIVRVAQADIIQDHVSSLIYKKSSEVDMEHYESHEYHDRLEQATSDGANRPLSLLESLGGLIQNLITLVVMAGLLVQYSLWLPIILLISTFPAFIIILRYDREYHQWWKATTSTRRWIQYFHLMLTHRLAVPEMRVFNLSPHFQTNYQKFRKKLRTEKLEQMRRLTIAKLFTAFLSLTILGLTLIWMGWRALNGTLTLGDLALFYQAFNFGQGLMRTMLGSLGKLIKDSLFLDILFEFLDLESNIKDPKSPVKLPSKLEKGIELRNITFAYPGSESKVFKDFSLFIPANKAVAIVGENGSGKSTLLKLLCRFYDPESGTIEYDGIDIKKFSVKELLRFITITFQVPLNYQATVKESIMMGNLDASETQLHIESAARNAGAHNFISQLPNGYDTLLGKAHAAGIELSGGEWQRLALARAYYSKAPLILLDEPTSMMDSWSEGEWFQRFSSLMTNKTAIVVTHRFTIAMRADLIFVIDKGQIAESGTHDELLEIGGLYAMSWKEQIQTIKETRQTDL